jgi:hypothetical protein
MKGNAMDLSAQQTALLFKPVAGGYVFRMPYQMGLAKVRHYLVSEGQKAELTATILGKRAGLTRLGLVLAAVGAVLIAALLVFSLSPHRNPGTSDTIAMFVLATVLIAAGFAAWRWWKLRQLEPMLAQLAPTDLQITRSEMRGRMLSGMSVKQLWLVVTLSVLAGAANLASGAYALSLGQSGVASIISGVIFVAVGFYYALHLVSRMKAAA